MVLITHLKLHFRDGTNVSSVRAGKFLKFGPVEISATEVLIPARDMHCGN